MLLIPAIDLKDGHSVRLVTKVGDDAFGRIPRASQRIHADA